MKLLGITGGVGMGKTVTGTLLEERGIPVADTDRLARQLVEPGQPALVEISNGFGSSILSADGSLDRKELARRIFSNAAERAKLEGILHPKIRAAWAAQVDEWRRSGRELAAVVIPLLYETKAESSFDAVICVACGAATQANRLRERGWSGGEIEQRLDAQWPVEEKISRADFVIWTDGPLEIHAAQLERILISLGKTG